MSNKQFPPSLSRIKKARNEGNIPKSPALVAIFSLTIGFICLFFIFKFAWVYCFYLVKLSVYQVNPAFQISFLRTLFITLFLSGLFITPFVGASLFLTWVEMGCSAALRLSKPKGTNIISRSFSSMLLNMKTIWLPFMVLLIVAVIFWFFYPFQKPLQVFAVVITVLWVAASVEYAIKRYSWYRGLMMTFQELKEEHRQNEGDPHAKAYRMAMQRAISMQSLEERVRRAKVIVVGKNVLSKAPGGGDIRNRSTAKRIAAGR